MKFEHKWKYAAIAERVMVEALLSAAKAKGFAPVEGDDGDGEWQPLAGPAEAVALIDSVELSLVRFVNPENSENFRVMLILGNGEDVISDHSANPAAEEIVRDAYKLAGVKF